VPRSLHCERRKDARATVGMTKIFDRERRGEGTSLKTRDYKAGGVMSPAPSAKGMCW